MPHDIYCPHFNLCPGCSLEYNVDQLPLLSEARAYFELKKSPFSFFVGSVTEWRARAKLAVRGTSEHPLVGLFKERSHDVLDIPFCQVHHPSINKAADLVRGWITQQNIQPYQEMGRGQLRYLQCTVDRSSGKIQLAVVLNTDKFDEFWKKKFELLWSRDESLWHSIWFNGNQSQTNTIFGSAWELFRGQPLLWETILGVEVCFQPASFAQANLGAFEQMLHSLKNKIPDNSRIAEFYAGIGVIGLCLAEKAAKVDCCEVNPFSQYCFEQSKNRLPSDVSSKIYYHTGSATEHFVLMKNAEIVIVDPPRKGLDKPFIEALTVEKNVTQLVYISCGWDSYRRDCDDLINRGWQLKLAEGYLFFPGSNHLETLAIFKR